MSGLHIRPENVDGNPKYGMPLISSHHCKVAKPVHNCNKNRRTPIYRISMNKSSQLLNRRREDSHQLVSLYTVVPHSYTY